MESIISNLLDYGVLGIVVIGLVLYFVWDRKQRIAQDREKFITDLEMQKLIMSSHEKQILECIMRHEKEREIWLDKLDKQYFMTLETFKKNTEVMSELRTIIRAATMFGVREIDK